MQSAYCQHIVVIVGDRRRFLEYLGIDIIGRL
nr:MAG TPA: Auxin responsive protein [Caudoviricetes sp.]